MRPPAMPAGLLARSVSLVVLECSVVDLHIRVFGINSTAPPATGGSVTLEGAVVDLHIGNIGINSSALEAACPPPGIGAKI
jgi:hypothetical protein